MTTCVRATDSHRGITRTVLGWFDNDEAVSPDDSEVVATRIAPDSTRLEAATGDTGAVVVGDVVDRGPHELGLITGSSPDRSRTQLRNYQEALAGIYTSDLATYGLNAASAASSHARTYGVELAGLFESASVPGVTDIFRELATYSPGPEVRRIQSQAHMVGGELARLLDTSSLVAIMQGYRDLYSTAWADLAQVTLTIESINRTVRETLRGLVGAYVRDHGHPYFEVEEGVDSPESAWTDDAANYPPLPRNYADVKVTISGPDKIKPRTYGDEDHQVWGL